jgi:competence protein ComEA
MKSFLHITYGVLIGMLAAGIIWLSTSQPRGEPIVLLETPTPGMLSVYVSGAISRPGVYTLPDGSRVEAAVKAAGGLSPNAKTEQINLAALLEDGQQVEIPGNVDTSQVNVGRVNINTASTSELDALPGIGPTTAQAIVDYRLQHSSFQFIQDILNVPGIGSATYARIKDYITTEP